MNEIPPPSLDSLRCFVEAARLLNFRAAAKAVALTPAALGQRIRQLEEQLECQLFHRTTRNVTLTQGGLALQPYAHKALEAAQACVRAARGDVAPPPMDLVFGTRYELGLSWIVPMLPELEKQFPTITTHLYFGSGSDLLLRVRSLEIDCAVTSSRLLDPKLDGIQLHREAYVFVGATKMLRSNPFKTSEHAANHTLIDTTPTLPLFRYWRDAPGGIDSMKFDSVRGMGTIAAIRAMAVNGQGVAVLPEYFVRDDLKAKRLSRVMPKIEALYDHFRLVFRADDPRRSLYEAIAEKMASMPLC